MGCNYELNQDGYIYLYSPNGNTEGTMNQLVLARVPKTRILQRSAYEFFVRTRPDGTADWAPKITDRGVVLTFPAGWVNQRFHPYTWHPCVVYMPGFDCYFMLNWGMGTDGDFWFTKPSYLGAWIAANPWGPWTQIHEEIAWMPGGDPLARTYQPQIPPKWISPDGKSFWLVWTDFQVIHGEQPYYSYNLQQVEVGE